MMTNMDNHPRAEANRISVLLRTVLGEERFPVDIKSVILEVSGKKFPQEPIVDIRPVPLNKFEGMLAKSPKGKKWIVGYNDQIASEGRIRFTLAHEFGHYLLHRNLQSEFNCATKDVMGTDLSDRFMEKEADTFASSLLMPLDDFRKQTEGSSISIDLLKHCGDRYGVSLTAAALKFRDVAVGRVIIVAAKDGYLDWACSNQAAYKSGAYFATTKETIEVPSESLLNTTIWSSDGQSGTIKANAWLPSEPEYMELVEHVFVIVGEGYSYTLGILVLPESDRQVRKDEFIEDDSI